VEKLNVPEPRNQILPTVKSGILKKKNLLNYFSPKSGAIAQMA
jgi:hypothetical protein